jgi:NADPH:quinone reductase
MAPGRTVRAARLVAHGRHPEVREVELGEVGAGEVVVEMAYAGVNPIDRYLALGQVAPDGPLPRTLGVEGVGRLDRRWVAVRGYGLGATRDGLWAQAAVVPRAAVVDVPDGVDPVAAAGAGVAGATAWRTVTELARVTPDDLVLVLGASGGVGSMIVTLARSIGARVWGQTGREGKAAALRARGARPVIAGTPGDLAGGLAGTAPTVVFDALGGDFTGAAIEALSPGGRLVLVGTSAGADGLVPLRDLYRKGLSVLGYGGLIEPPDALRQGIVGALEALRVGTMEVAVDSVLPLGDVSSALDRLARRAVEGKLVLDLRA